MDYLTPRRRNLRHPELAATGEGYRERNLSTVSDGPRLFRLGPVVVGRAPRARGAVPPREVMAWHFSTCSRSLTRGKRCFVTIGYLGKGMSHGTASR